MKTGIKVSDFVPVFFLISQRISQIESADLVYLRLISKWIFSLMFFQGMSVGFSFF
jgi:hypothetical protein